MEIYELLKKDHEEVKSLLDELIALKEDDDYRMVLIEQIKGALVPHARAEESILYNSIRAVGSDQAEIGHAYREHMEAETLLRTLQVKDSTNLDWRSTATKLKEALEHHIAEEEGNVFNVARSIFTADEARMMGDAFEKLKAKVAEDGFMKSSFDLIVNLMPPRFVEKVRSLGSGSSTT